MLNNLLRNLIARKIGNGLKFSRRREESEGNCPLNAASNFVLFGQCFGLLPVIGVSNNSTVEISFKWLSWRTFYSIVLTTSLLCYDIYLISQAFTTDTEIFSTVAVIVFFTSNVFGLMSFLFLAPKWPELMRYWESIAMNMPSFSNNKQKRRHVLKVRLLISTIVIMGIVEHFLSLNATLDFLRTCQQTNELKGVLFEIVPIVRYVFEVASYTTSVSIWSAILEKFISVTSVVVWTYIDIFLMVVSIELSTLFKFFNAELERSNNKEMNALQRTQYGQLCQLVQRVDSNISHIILLSFTSNLIFTCKQLFQSLRRFSSAIRMVYYWFSLMFLVTRTFLVSLYASRINDESKKPIKILKGLSSSSWSSETKRFYNDIVGNTVALSGMGFFFLTRRLILSITSSVATYELVLVQFHSKADINATCTLWSIA